MAIARVLHLRSTRLWRGYNVSLKSNPISTKALTCATAYAVGDTVAQLSTSRQRSLPDRLAALDPIRTGRLALFGLVFTGPSGHWFYNWLERMILPSMPASAASIGAKVACDQLLYTPVATAAFFVWVNLLSGTPARIASDVQEKLLPSTVAAWCLWAPASTINMAVVPAHLRMLFINAVSLVWTNILSRMSTVDARVDENLAVLPAVSLAPVWSAEPAVDMLHRPPRKQRRSTGSQPVNSGLARLPSRLSVLLDDLALVPELVQEGVFRLQFAMRGADRAAETMDLTLDDGPLESVDLGDSLPADGLLAEEEGLPESASFCCP